MRFLNTDTVSYQSKNPEKCLDTAEREKKKKYLNGCLNEIQYSTPFVASVDEFSGSRWRRHLNVSPAASRKSGKIRTHIPVGT